MEWLGEKVCQAWGVVRDCVADAIEFFTHCLAVLDREMCIAEQKLWQRVSPPMMKTPPTCCYCCEGGGGVYYATMRKAERKPLVHQRVEPARGDEETGLISQRVMVEIRDTEDTTTTVVLKEEAGPLTEPVPFSSKGKLLGTNLVV